MYEDLYIKVHNSLLNEISIDIRLAKLSGLNFNNRCIYKVFRFSNKIPSFFSPFFLMVMPVIFFILFFNSMRLRFCALGRIRHEIKGVNSIVFSERQKKVVNSYQNELKCISVAQLLVVSGKPLSALIYSLFIFFKCLRTIELKYCLHFIHIYELVLFRSALKQLGSNELLICSHYDRWATMLSFDGEINLSVLQHGVVSDDYFPEVKLSSPSRLICFSQSQADIFINNIFDLSAHDISVELYSRPIVISDNVNCDVLIINNPLYTEVELQLYSNLTNKGLDVIFRPHPLKIDKIKCGNINLSVGESYPSPKLFVCRESTLGCQYEIVGYKGIWWSSDDCAESLADKIVGIIR